MQSEPLSLTDPMERAFSDAVVVAISVAARAGAGSLDWLNR
jgi:hypothetical protein